MNGYDFLSIALSQIMIVYFIRKYYVGKLRELRRKYLDMRSDNLDLEVREIELSMELQDVKKQLEELKKPTPVELVAGEGLKITGDEINLDIDDTPVTPEPVFNKYEQLRPGMKVKLVGESWNRNLKDLIVTIESIEATATPGEVLVEFFEAIQKWYLSDEEDINGYAVELINPDKHLEGRAMDIASPKRKAKTKRKAKSTRKK